MEQIKEVPFTIDAVTFFGSSKGQRGEPNYDAAFAVASEIAKTGRKIINGGGPGVMLAATEGATSVGGTAAVVYYKPTQATRFEGALPKNLVDEHYEESNYIMRTKKLLELGDAYIVFNGGTGTISEFAMAWGLARLYFGHHKPVLLYGEFWHDIMKTFQKNMMIREEEQYVYSIVNSPQEVMDKLAFYEKVIQENRHGHTECVGEECSFLLL